jgi:hypothetical protein
MSRALTVVLGRHRGDISLARGVFTAARFGASGDGRSRLEARERAVLERPRRTLRPGPTGRARRPSRAAVLIRCTPTTSALSRARVKIPGAVHGGPTELSPAVQAKAGEACGLKKLLPRLKWNQQLVSGYFFVPTEAQWREGARWIRCDRGVLATGPTLGNESFSALPTRISTLVNALTSDPLRFEFCVNSPFPDSATSNAASSRLCLPGVTSDDDVWMTYLPTKAGWAAGDREIDCWIGQKSGDTGSGGTV